MKRKLIFIFILVAILLLTIIFITKVKSNSTSVIDNVTSNIDVQIPKKAIIEESHYNEVIENTNNITAMDREYTTIEIQEISEEDVFNKSMELFLDKHRNTLLEGQALVISNTIKNIYNNKKSEFNNDNYETLIISCIDNLSSLYNKDYDTLNKKEYLIAISENNCGI